MRLEQLLDYVGNEAEREIEASAEDKTPANEWRHQAREFGRHVLEVLRQVIHDEMVSAHARGLCVHQTIVGLINAVDELGRDKDAVVNRILEAAPSTSTQRPE